MITLRSVLTANQTSAQINDKWVPARPVNYRYRTIRERIRDAWAVFTGKADAMTWPEGQ